MGLLKYKTSSSSSSSDFRKGRIRVHQNQIVSGGYITRTYAIRDFPSEVVPGILYRLHQLNELNENKKATIKIAQRFIPGAVKWDWKMKMKFARLESAIQEQRTKPGGIVDQDIERAYYALLYLKNKDQKQQSRVLDVWIYITIQAPSELIVKSLESTIQKELSNINIELKKFKDEQDMAIKATLAASLPVKDFYRKHTGRLMDDDAASMFFPLTDGSFSDGKGTYFGHRAADRSPIYINLEKDENNKNIVVLGASGEGKSTFLKALVVSLLMQGYRVFVFDVDGEYFKLSEYVKGKWIDHTLDSGRYIDPVKIMEPIGNPKTDSGRYTAAASRMKRVISLLAGDVKPGEMTAADKALKKTWTDAGIYKYDPETWCTPKAKKEATIHRWYANLQELAENDESAKNLLDKIWSYFEGTMSDMFAVEDSQEDVVGAERLTVFHVAKEINNQEEQRIGAVKMAMSQDTVLNEITREKEKGVTFSAVIFDEGQRILQNESMSNYIQNVGTTIRKFNGLLVLATNHPSTIWDTKGGEALWDNSSIKVVFWMEESPLKKFVEKSGFPIDVVENIKTFYQTRKFVVRYKDPQRLGKEYDVARLQLSSEEAELYRTRRTNAN